jgi:hypothetical protein
VVKKCEKQALWKHDRKQSQSSKIHMMPEIDCADYMGLQVKALLSWRHALVIFFFVFSAWIDQHN